MMMMMEVSWNCIKRHHTLLMQMEFHHLLENLKLHGASKVQLIKEILKLSELHFVSVHDRGVGGIITAIDKLV